MPRNSSKRFPHCTLVILISALSTPVLAAPPSFQDVRSMGMGGTGVAAARPSGAVYHNPALLSLEHGHWQNDFAITLPGAYGRFADSEDVPDEIDDIQETIRELENSNPGNVRSNAGRLADQLEGVDGDTLRGDLGLGFNVAKPGQELGLGFHMSGRLRATIQGNISEQDIGDLRTIESGIFDLNDLLGGDDLESRGRVQATAILEAGVSFSTQMDLGQERIAIGITPKYMQLRTFDYIENVDDFDDDDFNASEFETQKNGVNFDIGAAIQAGDRDQWRYGVSIRNVLPMSLKAARQDFTRLTGDSLGDDNRPEMKIRPLVTAGVAHSSSFHTLTADLDLTRTRAFGPEAETQWLSVGGEINLIDWINLRAGARQNLASNTGADGIEEKTQFTAGVAFSPFALRIEIAALLSDDEIGAAAELGLAF
ncbi:MAG: conjugal transfer protein TraF [Halomonadaceae bacterium]|nr:MAG: conjugal transfer protein TraF [Halomonadaceae bacterium]